MMTKISESPVLDLNRSGTWGLKSATWRQIEQALEMLGARMDRTASTGHRVFHLNDIAITLPNRSKASQETGRGVLAEHIKRVGEAGVQPALFVAVLSSLGAGWIKKPTDLRELERLARLNPTLLVGEKGRRKIIEVAEENLKRQHNPKEEVAEVAEAELKHTHNLTDAIRLGLGEEASKRFLNRYQSRISQQLKRQRGVVGRLAQEGHLVKTGDSQSSPWMATEKAAMDIAHYVETSATEDGVLPITSPRPQEMAESKPEPVEERPRIVPPGTPLTGPAAHEKPVPQGVPEPKERRPFRSPGEALLYLCQRFDVEPHWVIGDYQLAHENTIKAIAEKVREQE